MTKLHTLLEEQLFKLQVHTLSSGYDVNHRTQQINLNSILDVISKALDTEVRKCTPLPVKQGSYLYRNGYKQCIKDFTEAWDKVMEEK